jgi:hypothetical protein
MLQANRICRRHTLRQRLQDCRVPKIADPLERRKVRCQRHYGIFAGPAPQSGNTHA